MGLVAKHGMPACWGQPEFADAEKRIAKACKDNGVVISPGRLLTPYLKATSYFLLI